MTPDQTRLHLKRFYTSIRRAWILSVRLARNNPEMLDIAAERFATVALRRALDAGYNEARHLGTNVFDPINSGDKLRAHRLQLINDFKQSAVDFRYVGLTERQIEAVRTYKLVLENTALNDPSDLPRDAARSTRLQVARYAKVMTDQRADFLGRTIANTMLHLGVEEADDQNINLGLVEIEKIWGTFRDEKVRSSHSSMEGQVRGHKEPFISGNGNSIMNPGDPAAPISETASCRCTSSTRVKAKP
jgi:hypothetical protein